MQHVTEHTVLGTLSHNAMRLTFHFLYYELTGGNINLDMKSLLYSLEYFFSEIIVLLN